MTNGQMSPSTFESNRPRSSFVARGQDVFSVLLASTVTLAVQAVVGAILARTLGPAHRGEYAVIVLWPAAVSVFATGGYIQAAIYMAATKRGHLKSDATYGTLLAVAIVLGGTLAALSALLIPHILVSQRPLVVHLAVVFSFTHMTNLLQNLHTSLLQGLGEMRSFAKQRMVIPVVYAIFVAYLYMSNSLSVSSAVYALALAQVVGVAVAWRRVFGFISMPLKFDVTVLKAIVRYGAKGHLSDVAAAANGRLDQIVLSIATIPAQLGLYAVAATAASAVNAIGQSIASVAFPAGSAITTADEPRFCANVIRMTVLTVAPVVAAAMLAVPTLIPVIFGSDYAGSVASCEYLLLGAVPMCITLALYGVLRSRDLGLIPSASEFLGLLGFAALLGILIPRAGIVGAAIASTGASLISLGAVLMLSRRYLKFRWREAFVVKTSDCRRLVQLLKMST
jgi:O-antigen/teichoic acid export membrane protein